MNLRLYLNAINIFFLVQEVISSKNNISPYFSTQRISECIGEAGLSRSTQDEILCQELLGFQEEMDRQKISNIHVSFENFVGQLRTYFNETNFDADRFESDLGNLGSRFANIENEAQKYMFDDELREQFLFALKFLDVMKDSARFMKCYILIKLPGSHLVYKLVELYARTFALQNAIGELHASVTDYCGKMMGISSFISNLQRELEKLEDVPLLIELMFHDQVGRIKKTVEAFKSNS